MSTLPLDAPEYAHHLTDDIGPGQGFGETCPGETSEPRNCPRCGGAPRLDGFHGPCETCVGSLRHKYRADDRPVVDRTVTLRKRTYRQEGRRTATVEVGARRMFDHGGRSVVVGGSGLLDVLAAAGDHRAVVVCDEDGPALVRSWAETAAPAGWVHRSAWVDDRSSVVDLEEVETGRRVRVSVGAQWTGGPAPADRTGEALRAIRAGLEWAWRTDGGTLLGSPATTGRDLMARALPEGLALDALAGDVADEIRDRSGQHRMELLPYQIGREVEGLVEMDARLAYAAVTWGLPAGEPARRRGEPADPRGRWRGRCSWTVPHDWRGPGILPERGEDGWSWASDPGATGGGWLDGAEVDLARRWGWSVEVHECIEWEAGPDPLRTWTRRLVDAHGDTLAAERAGEMRPEVGALVRAGYRAILLHGIGALHGGGQVVSHVSRPEEVPAHALDATLTDDGEAVVWTERKAPAWPEMSRPEWTSTIWARMRCRLLDAPGAKVRGKAGPRVGALHVDPREVVGFRGDAIYLTRDPGWFDDGQPGRFRPKGQHAPMTVPASLAELDRLRTASTGGGADRARAALAAARAGR